MCAHGKIADWIVLHLVVVHACTCARTQTGLRVEDLIVVHLLSVLHCGVVQSLVTPLLVLVFLLHTCVCRHGYADEHVREFGCEDWRKRLFTSMDEHGRVR